MSLFTQIGQEKCWTCGKNMSSVDSTESIIVHSCFEEGNLTTVKPIYCSDNCMKRDVSAWRCIVCQVKMNPTSKCLTITDITSGQLTYIASCSPACFKKVYKQIYFDDGIFRGEPYITWPQNKTDAFFVAIQHVPQSMIDKLKEELLDKADVELAVIIALTQWLNPICRACHQVACHQRCRKCQLVFYCNRACQEKDWESHRDACKYKNLPSVVWTEGGEKK